jgi:hypothetical protein
MAAAALNRRNPTDAEIFAALFADIEKEPGEGFTERFPAGRWLRWDEDLDGDGEAEIVIAATDRWSACWLYILDWEGTAYAVALEAVTPSQYYADIQASLADVNGDGGPEVVVDTLTYGRDEGIVSMWWSHSLARCANGECAVIWGDDILQATSSYQPDAGSADLVVRRCEPGFADVDGDAAPELVETCTGFEAYVLSQEIAPEGAPEAGSGFPSSLEAEKAIAPTSRWVFAWDGRAYAESRYRELYPGQLVSGEFSLRSQQARALVDGAVVENLQAQGLSTTGEAFWDAIEQSWGLQGESERVAVAAAGKMGPPEGDEVVGLIVGGEQEGCRLVLLAREAGAAYAPAETMSVPCEPNFARLEALDLDADGRSEILFHTLVVTETQPVLYDRLTVLARGGTGWEVRFRGEGALPDGTMRGVAAADLDEDGVYELVRHLPAFDLDVGPDWRDDVAWPTLDRLYEVYRWDADTGQYRFWQTRREPFGDPGSVEIVEEAP